MSDDVVANKLPPCPNTPAAKILYARGKCRLKGKKAKRPATQNKSKLPPCSGLPRVLVPKMIAAGKCRESTGSLKPKKTPDKARREVSCVRACSNKPKTFSLSSIFTSVLKIAKDCFRPMINVFKEIFLEILHQGDKRKPVVLEEATIYFLRAGATASIRIMENSKVQLVATSADVQSMIYDFKTEETKLHIHRGGKCHLYVSKDKRKILDEIEALLIKVHLGPKAWGYWKDPGSFKALIDTPDFGCERAEKILLKLKEIIGRERPFVIVSGSQNYI